MENKAHLAKRTRSQRRSVGMANNPPEAKRQHLTRSSSSRSSSRSRSSRNDATTASHPRPKLTVVSSSRQTLGSIDDNSNSNNQLVSNDDHVFKNDSSTTRTSFKNIDGIESALCIVSDTKQKYTRYEILKALKDLRRWGRSNNRWDVFKELSELGGIPRLLKFLTTGKARMFDTEYIYLVSSIISSCTFIGNNIRNHNNEVVGEIVARKFVERGGISTMLRANHNVYRGGSKLSALKALDSIWASLGNVISRKTVLDKIEKDQTLSILDNAIATLRLLNCTTTDATWVPRILIKIFSVLAFLSSCSPDASLVAADCKGKHVFQTCFDAIMKDSVIYGDFNSQVWSVVSRFFINCYNRLFFAATNGHDDLVKTIIPFYIEYVKIAPNEAFKEGAFGLLFSAGEVIGKSLMAEAPYLMTTLGRIIDSTNNDNIEHDTKLEAKKILKYWL
jgi:hypothetical protein